MIGSKYLNRIGRIRKRIKIPVKKKNFSYHSSLVINKNVFYLKKLTIPKLNDQFFFLEKNHDNAEYK